MVAIVRRSPGRALRAVEPFYHPMSLLDEAEVLARDLWESWEPFRFHTTGMIPRMDMYEDKNDLVIKADLPGIDKEHLNISLEGDCLTITAEKKEEKTSEEATQYSCERYYGKYSRTITLPVPVDTDKISATLEHGLLEIRLPKAEEAKSKAIKVNVK